MTARPSPADNTRTRQCIELEASQCQKIFLICIQAGAAKISYIWICPSSFPLCLAQPRGRSGWCNSPVYWDGLTVTCLLPSPVPYRTAPQRVGRRSRPTRERGARPRTGIHPAKGITDGRSSSRGLKRRARRKCYYRSWAARSTSVLEHSLHGLSSRRSSF